MHDWIMSWGWLWVTFVMVFWIGVLAAVVSAALRLGPRPRLIEASRDPALGIREKRGMKT